ncbi:MAG: hypothetical protein N2043_02100 [Ignavibacterium sp.]|nr:hypothetical protein [Ignavibacterium sp.]
MEIAKLRIEQIKATTDEYENLGEQLRAMPESWEYVVHPEENQKTFVLPREYTMGYKNLIVYLNGQKVQGPLNDEDIENKNYTYIEVNPTTIEFNEDIYLSSSDTIVFRQEGVGAGTSFVAEVEHVVREKPQGIMNGINKQFQLSKYPKPNTECVFYNGVLLDPENGDYTIDGRTITLSFAPEEGDRIHVNYLRARNAIITYRQEIV